MAAINKQLEIKRETPKKKQVFWGNKWRKGDRVVSEQDSAEGAALSEHLVPWSKWTGLPPSALTCKPSSGDIMFNVNKEVMTTTNVSLSCFRSYMV